jgi:hypothetical protein
MATDAHGRQLSDDGNYYWDGSNWQLVDQSSTSGGDGSTPQQQYGNVDAHGRQLSDDGNYYWDGSNWQLVAQGAASGDGSGSSPQVLFAQAMAKAGYNIDASALPDLGTLQSGIADAMQLYQGLDSDTQSIINAATADPGEASICLSESGAVTGIDPLLQAFDQVQGSLGDLLQASQQALETAQQSAAN